ncbi:MAG TPA: MFS transporter [Solirubrobacteraceae bacterium]
MRGCRKELRRPLREHVVIPALLLLAAALALADASIVTLALPPIIDELNATVQGAAAVLGCYTLVLAVALPVAARLRVGARALGAGGAAVFAVASLGCAVAGSLGALLALRCVQAAGAAALLVGAFALLDAGGPGRRSWNAAAIFGFAAGPALGGALTQAFDWRAIFAVQVPVAVAAALAAWRSREPQQLRDDDRQPWPVGPAIALALLSAALVGVLFLLVLLLVTGWSVSPLGAAAAVSILPVAAVAAARIGGPPRVRAAAGALLVAGGVLMLASVPTASSWWIVLPQVLAGAGLGLALPALAGDLLPERTAGQAARLLSARHAGITIALALLAPVAAARIDDAVAAGREQGTALVLDARLPPLDKLDLAAALVGDLDPVDPRGQLQDALESARSGIDAEDQPAYDELARRADDAVVAGVDGAFAPAFAICGVLALLAAVALLPWDRRVAAAAAAALVLAGGARLIAPAVEPEPVRIADPCHPRALPHTGGIDGALQDAALSALDRAACRYGSSREELALALVDEAARRDYERKYGVDPRSIGGVLRAVLGV